MRKFQYNGLSISVCQIGKLEFAEELYEYI